MSSRATALPIDDDAGFGELLVLIANVIAVQAKLVCRRVQGLAPHASVGHTHRPARASAAAS